MIITVNFPSLPCFSHFELFNHKQHRIYQMADQLRCEKQLKRVYTATGNKSTSTFFRSTFVLCLFRCGYATLHNVRDKTQEDRMESFFLSETSKYLYLVSFV